MKTPKSIGFTTDATSTGFKFQAMSSACEIRLECGSDTDEAQLHAAATLAIAEVARIEQKYSRYKPDSIVSRINAAAGSAQAVEVDVETAALLNFAQTLHEMSDGLFDITSGVLRRAWNFQSGQLPSTAALNALLPLIGWGGVDWNLNTNSIRLPQLGMELDFGGFGKEYAADRAMAVLSQAGIRHGFVNLGGDIRVLGARANGAPWRFGIQHPRALYGGAEGTPNANAAPLVNTISSVDLKSGALASSGDYERYFELEGCRYCHILNPKTGWPVTTWASISVTAPACVAAGALSTIAMLKGEDALAFLETQAATFLAVDTELNCVQSRNTHWSLEGN